MKRIRCKITIIFFLLCGLCILVQSFRLQVLDIFGHQKELKKIVIPCKRGVIYDRHGEPLAITTQTSSLYACPDVIKKPEQVARKLSKILHIEYKSLLKRLKRKGEFIWLKRWLTPKEASLVERLDIDGLNFRPENKRSYPHGYLAGQVLGFVGVDGVGLEGIERKFDEFLQGIPGFYFGIKDAHGRIILAPRQPIKPAQDGHSLRLSIDANIQYQAEQVLKKAVQKWHAKKGCVIVVVPQSGEILAMANYPFFDPNNFRHSSPSIWRNHAIADSFEPGSTFKTFLLAAAFDKGIWSPHDILYAENGRYRLENITIHDVQRFGWLSVENAIIYSSNIGAVKIGLKVGKEIFYQYIKKFGFSEKTGIDLNGESPGLVRSLSRWSKVDTATICFGQGVGVTALQLAMAYSAIANGGKLMRPLLVERIYDAQGKVVKVFEPEVKRQVISPVTAALLRKILRKVVIKGTGQKADIAGYEVAGKTGTSQKVNPKTGKYYQDKYIASFAGFFPASHPRVVIVVVIDEPHPLYYGGIVAAPVFKEIAQHIIWQWHLAPSTSPKLKMAKTKTQSVFIPKSLSDFEGIDEAIAKGVMPDLQGLPLRLALRILQKLNLQVKIEGAGRVIKQFPAPGTKIRENTVCLLQLGVDE
jgi:cell division protein FtsI (penicillin-binding protein 3)